MKIICLLLFFFSLNSFAEERFRKDKKGLIHDSKFSVVWFLIDYNYYTYAKAKNICDSYLGKLPTKEQLQSILHNDGIYEKPISYFSGLSGNYWTSTVIDGYPMRMNLDGGGMHMYDKPESKHKVLCLRWISYLLLK